ncbi:MAG: S9 family peptidase [Acidobacteria bacterium]|nr:S9 family peptidase [Acidobacteriota bacterium]
MQWADHPVLSPDGRQIVYERTFFDPMKDVRRSNLWVIDVASSAQRPLTTGSGRDSLAAWSPDGGRLAYVGSEGGRPQIFVRWMATGETARITQLSTGAGNLVWSPDGKWIAFTAFVRSEGKPLATKMPTPPEGAQWAAPAKVIDKLLYRADGAGYLDPGYVHVFVVPGEGGAVRRVTQGDHNFGGQPSWTRDGRSLILSANLSPDWEHQPMQSDLYRIDVQTGEATRLTTRTGPDEGAVVSPDGKRVAYLGFEDRKLGYQNWEIFVLDLATGKSRALSAALDRSVNSLQWDGDTGLFLTYDDRGETRLAWVPAEGGALDLLAGDLGGTSMGRPYTGSAMSAAGGKVAYTRGTPHRPADVALVGRDKKVRVLTDLGTGLLDQRNLGRVEPLTWASGHDRREVQGWLVHPPDFNPAKRYPLLLEIHGGPFAAYGPHFAPETQLYAAQGYLVLYANPRGSTSYGHDFANLIHHNYPNQDYDDLLSGVDAVIAKGGVDKANLFVTGGSGGGVLTSWIVGHTNRFRAAVVAKPVINWTSFVLTSDGDPYFTQYWFPGMPWEHPEQYAKRSPITYVGNVVTPTMLLVGEADYRTPISEAEQFYMALKLRKIDTMLVRLPGASHDINERPSQMLAQVLHTIAWFERYRAK